MDKFRFPELFLAEILQQTAREKIPDNSENPSIFKRALVVAVDVEGGKLQNSTGVGKLVHTVSGQSVEINSIIGPANPRNSIKARVLSDGFDQFLDDESLKIYYPLMPEHMAIPVKPGEHVLVLFEDENYENGWWISKVPGHEGVNFSQGEKLFIKDDNNKLSKLFPDTAAVASTEEDVATDEAAGESLPNGRLTKLFF